MNYCLNCGHEQHDGPLWKEFLDGDNQPIMIEVCKQYRGKVCQEEETVDG
jgi:hypothetical protein|tara:strand:+ start:3860 stop:4009 length:150 start_codon:yes stop_codon:yes gene_type:complete